MDASDIQGGLHFNLPEETYHAIPVLSSTGIKDLLMSPVDFLARSWMNTEPEDADEEDDKDLKKIGHAYHARILEG